MKLARLFCLSFAVLLGVASPAAAGRVERATEVVEPDDFEDLVVKIDFAAGTIDIHGADMDEPAKLDIYYTPRFVEYEFYYDKRGKTCRLFIESEIRKNRWDKDGLENEWTLQLSRNYRTRLDLDIGACEARFDLGGIPLIDLQINVGAADIEIDFSEPNPERLREINIDCGASALQMYGLANANCGRFDFDIGAGSCDLDFRGGEIRGEIEVTIDVGMGSMDIIVPRGVAIMVIGDDGWFSSLDFHGMKLNQTRRGDWVSDDFDEAKNRIIFDIDVSMGSVDIYAKK